jgi:prepilin-type N-terminal cleavage/methylation domain-containing protein
MHRSRSAFTMMEMMLAIALAVIVMTIAIPTIGSIFEKDDLQATYEKFGEFVQKAQNKAVSGHRTMLIVWHERDPKRHMEAGLTLEPEILTSDEADAEPETFGFDGAEVRLERPYALEDKPLPVWPFWRSGTCEPVRVSFKGKAGHWIAEFDPLTTRGTIVEMSNE